MSHPKLYEIRGAHYHHESQTTSFCLYAPNARNVWLVLTAYGIQQYRLQMIKNHEGLWEIVTDKAPPGRTYLYLIDDYHGRQMLRTDPVSFSIVSNPITRRVQSVVHDETVYSWNDQNWMRQRARTNPLISPLSIYEIQPKSWKSGVYWPLNFRQIAGELATYCNQMGFTHVEMYGILEHTDRWEYGYQVANYFAPSRFSGICDDLKYLIEHLHQNGIGVILDWVPTHFKHYHFFHQYSNSLHEYDGTNLYASTVSQWWTLYFDFDKEETRRLLFASALYYLDRLHFDGIRFDAVSQMIRRNQTDIPSAISFLRELNHTIHTHYPGVLCIAEETEGYPNLSRAMNFDLKWNIGWSNDVRNFLRTPYAERPQHWKQKILDVLNCARWSDDKMICTLSHDDTDTGPFNSKNVLLNCVSHARNDMDKFADLRNLFAWQRCVPSRGHMIHMGDEIVQPMSWFQRCFRGKSSMDWSLSNSTSLHGKIQECIRDLNHLYIRYPQFWQYGEKGYSLIYEYGENLVIAYHRGIFNNRRIAVIHNFSNRGYTCYDIPLPGSDPNVGRIRDAIEIFNTDDPKYGGSGAFQNEQIQIKRNSGQDRVLTVVLPPLSTIILEENLA
jgi:1,4-alpha-glucan branching enzyme